MDTFTRTFSESGTLSEMGLHSTLGPDRLVRCEFISNSVSNGNNSNNNKNCYADASSFFFFSGDGDKGESCSQWDRFKRSHQIGSGTFGDVFLCYDMLSTSPWYRQPVAVKVVSMEALSDNEVVSATNEIAILRHLQHENIIGYIDSFIDNEKQLCLVSEYVDGGDLAVMIRRGCENSDDRATVEGGSLYSRCEEERGEKKSGNDSFTKGTKAMGSQLWIESYLIADIVRQCLEALSYLHNNFIIHRDIKPANLFIKSNGVLKLGDFGVSKLVELTDPMASTFIGTPFYLSPELSFGEPYSFATDIWALGVIAYEMYCLKLPFLADNVLAQIYVVTEGHYDKEALYQSHLFNSSQLQKLKESYGDAFLQQEDTLHRLVVELVERMLVLDPLERPSASQLLREFFYAGPSCSLSSAEGILFSRASSAAREGSLKKHVASLQNQTDCLQKNFGEYGESFSPALLASRVETSYDALVNMLPPERQEHALRAASRPGFSAVSVGGRSRFSPCVSNHEVDLDATIRSETRHIITETMERVPWLRDARVFSSVSLQDGYNDNVVRVDWIDNDRFSLLSSQRKHGHSFFLHSRQSNEENMGLPSLTPDELAAKRNMSGGGVVKDAMEIMADDKTSMSSIFACKGALEQADLLPVAAHGAVQMKTQQPKENHCHHEGPGEGHQQQKEEGQQQQQHKQSAILGRCEGFSIETLEALLRAKIMASCVRRQRRLKEIREARAAREEEQARMHAELSRLYAKSFSDKRKRIATQRGGVVADETVGSPVFFATTQRPQSAAATSFLPAAELNLPLADTGLANKFTFEQQSLGFFSSFSNSMKLDSTMDHSYLANEVEKIARNAADVADRCAMWSLRPPPRLDFTKMCAEEEDEEEDRCSTSPSVTDPQRGLSLDVYDIAMTLCIVQHESEITARGAPSPSPVTGSNVGSLVLPMSVTLKPINRRTRLGGVVWRVKETLKAFGLSHALLFPLDIDDAEEVGAEELGLRYVDRVGDVIAITGASDWLYVKCDWRNRSSFTWLPLYMVKS